MEGGADPEFGEPGEREASLFCGRHQHVVDMCAVLCRRRRYDRAPQVASLFHILEHLMIAVPGGAPACRDRLGLLELRQQKCAQQLARRIG